MRIANDHRLNVVVCALFIVQAFSHVITVAVAVVFTLGAVVARSVRASGRQAHQV